MLLKDVYSFFLSKIQNLIDLRTFVAKFFREDLRTFWPEKRNPQTFLLFGCMSRFRRFLRFSKIFESALPAYSLLFINIKTQKHKHGEMLFASKIHLQPFQSDIKGLLNNVIYPRKKLFNVCAKLKYTLVPEKLHSAPVELSMHCDRVGVPTQSCSGEQRLKQSRTMVLHVVTMF